METTEKRTIKMTFNVNGENITNLIRDCWAECRILPAINIIESCGCPEQFWLDVFTGNAKIEGNSNDDTLHVERDNSTMNNGIDITFDAMNKRMIDEFIKQSIIYANADARMKYWLLRCDYIGVSYKTGKLSGQPDGNTYEKDKRLVVSAGRALAEMKPFFTKIYPLKGLSLYDLPYHRVEAELEEFDFFHPNYLPVMEDRVKNGKDVQSTTGKNELEASLRDSKYKPTVGFISDAISDIAERPKKEREKLKPYGIDVEYVENAWIDRNGIFWGSDRSSIGFELVHINLAEQMHADGIIPEELTVETKGSPEKYLEHTGWVKLSANQFLYYPRNHRLKLSDAQLKTIKKYAQIRNMTHVNIGYFDKNIEINSLTKEMFE